MKLKNIFLLSVSALTLAACANNNETNDNQANADAEVVTVAVENASKPLSFTDNTGELVGYEIDVINAINENIEGYEIQIESVDSEAAQVGLDTGKYAFIGGGLYQTPEREEKYIFPEENTGVSTIRIYTRAEDAGEIQTLDDLSQVTVHPVTPNGGIFNLLTKYNEENPDNQINIQKGESGDFAQRFQALDEGVSDAIVMPSNLDADQIIEQLELDVVAAEEPVQVNPTYFMIAPDQTELKSALDPVIKELKDNGTLSELSEKWYGEDMFQYEE